VSVKTRAALMTPSLVVAILPRQRGDLNARPCAQGSDIGSDRSIVVREFLTFYNNPGNLLSLNQEPRRREKIQFGHSFDTAEKQGRELWFVPASTSERHNRVK